MLNKCYIEAENFRDKAWGIAELGNGVKLVLEMTEGYSDLYLEYKDGAVKYLLAEEPSHKDINKVAAEYGVEFIYG